MIVRCIETTGDALPSASRDPLQGIDMDTVFAVSQEREYPVYAVTVLLGITWYYVMDDDRHPWPTWVPAPLFDVVDGSLPSSWRLGYFRFARDDQYPILSFPEWAQDHQFYERLVDGDPVAVEVFSHRRVEVEALPRNGVA